MNDLGLPGWLLKLIASYLSKRVMIVRFKGSESKEENMPGGSPQGTILGVVIFILQMILMRSISLDPNENLLTFPGEKSPSTSCKFIDDLTSAVSFKIKDLEHSDDITKPLVYHSRTEHILPSLKNILVPELERIVNFTETNKMKLNTKKTSIIMFNRSKTKDFQPEFYINDELLNVVESVKLVGVMLSSDLKWDRNVHYMCQKAQKRLWMLRRIKDLGGSKQDLLCV